MTHPQERGGFSHGNDNDTKILAAHAGLPEVKAGQLIRAKLDMVLGNDITSPVAIREFEKEGFTGVFDKSKISMVMDHFTPNKGHQGRRAVPPVPHLRPAV